MVIKNRFRNNFTAEIEYPIQEEKLCWQWCLDHLEIGTWYKTTRIQNSLYEYHFKKEEDYLAFRLKFRSQGAR